MRAHSRVRARACACVYAHEGICALVCARTCVCVHACVCKHMRVNAYMCMHVCVHACVGVCVCVHTLFAYVCVCEYAFSCVQAVYVFKRV